MKSVILMALTLVIIPLSEAFGGCYVLRNQDCISIVGQFNSECANKPCVIVYPGAYWCNSSPGYQTKPTVTQQRAVGPNPTTGVFEQGLDFYQNNYNGTPIKCTEVQACYQTWCIGSFCKGGSWAGYGADYYPQVLTGVICFDYFLP